MESNKGEFWFVESGLVFKWLTPKIFSFGSFRDEQVVELVPLWF